MSNYNAVLARNTENAPKNIGISSQTVAFSHYNNLSAQLPIDPKSGAIVAGGIKAQAEQCFKNIKAIVESIDHAMSDIVRITVFVTNIKDVDAVDEVYKSFFTTYVPTRTTVAVVALPMDALVQVEALVSNGVGSIPNAPQAGDLIKLTNNTANAPISNLSTQTVAFSHYNNISAQLPIDPKSGKLVTGGVKEQAAQCLKNVKAILEERFKNLATRKDRAVGNNMYPNMTEELLEVPEVDFAGILKARKTDLEVNVKVRDNAYVEAVLSDLGKRDASELGSLIADAEKALLAGATMGEISAALTGSANGEKVEAIAPHRWTERYEELRMRTENFVDKTGANVKIFLANMGPIPQHKARADFVTSFMQVAAFEVVTNNGFLTVEEAVKAALESGADAAIVCSTDATYPELAPAVTKGIKAVNPEMKVFLAGAPSAELKEICDAAGMDDYISVKSNCYETLLRMQKERGMF